MNGHQKRVLDLLNENCRIPLEQMAVMLGMDIQEVAGIIDTLEKDGIILSYRPIINWDKAERNMVEAMIEVKVTPQRDFGFDAVARRINNFEEVRGLYLMSGTYDLLIQVAAPTLKELAQFVSERLSPLETVTGTSTSFVLKRYKQDGVVFDRQEEDRRLSVSP
ncbi:MAG TPA: Lrp/AsnC family transcriptional regulator [Clostridia bacterium]|jgi:DNA-binding Lrp family transcriptional regulator|nr:Lrp/AsnC family transcriptional regulator [Clostridia bacterium]HPA61610.1 Lrp/AsnC family transcriptional regulator [Clostridia bacterium]HQA96359.1 Lrp/AsnC family transcriptional regulator [Clostridia bacterium]HQO55572.1 Lrp/AsnC family transcriptional regulator [Clostridia bacterium]HUM60624.1 Lrp/AsnC family transcriptional regulator [Clostridia bacterium]